MLPLLSEKPNQQMDLADIVLLSVNRLAFGDSYTYVQGTFGRQNYSFIADELNPSYTKEILLTNKIVQNQVLLFSTMCLMFMLMEISARHLSRRT